MWKGLTGDAVWQGMQRAIVAPNGPADLLIHTWDGELSRRVVRQLSSSLCASVCEAYGAGYMLRITSILASDQRPL